MIKVDRKDNDNISCNIDCSTIVDIIEETSFLIAFCKKNILSNLEKEEDKINAMDIFRQSIFAGLDEEIKWD